MMVRLIIVAKQALYPPVTQFLPNVSAVDSLGNLSDWASNLNLSS
jgi:hypothetical protein